MPTLPPRFCDHCHTQTNGTRRLKCTRCERKVCRPCVASPPSSPTICIRCAPAVPSLSPYISPPSSSLPTDPVTTYADAVVSGRITANRWVRLACQRHLDDLKRDDLYFDPIRAQQVIDFFRLVLRLSTGKWEGRPFTLLDFQEFIQGSIFGWYWKDPADRWIDDKGHTHYKRRRFEVAYIEISKGAGKSPLAAGTGIFMAIGDRTPRAECFFAASKKEQAQVSFQYAVAMADLSPLLKSRFVKAGQNPCWQLSDPKTGGSYLRPIASDDRKSGPTVHFCGADELHEHPDDIVLSMMRQGMKGENPLLYITTNSGTDRTSVCWQQRLQATQMLEGKIPNDSLFAYICGLDDEELKVMGLMKQERGEAPIQTQDPIDFLLAHEELWIKANPAIGRVRSFEYVRKRLTEAKGLPAQRNRVLRLQFCVWTDSQTVWIPDSIWMGCADTSLASRIPHPKFGEITRLEEELIGKRCYMGIDLAHGAGFHALILIFPDDEGRRSQELLDLRLRRGDTITSVAIAGEEGEEEVEEREDSAPSISDPNNQIYTLLEYFFMDREAFDTRALEQSIFHVWREDGDLEVWPSIVALGSLLSFITGTLMTRYSISACAYDPAFVSPQMALNLEQAGLKMVTWEQQYRLMHAPITEAERRAKVGLWRHRGHPIMRWMLGNVNLETDRGGRHIIDKRRLKENVDGPSALATGLGWCMRDNRGEEKGSVYERRGVLVFEDVYL